MIEVEGEYLVWEKKDCGCYRLIGLNVSYESAIAIATTYADTHYHRGWKWQGDNIFRADCGPGSPSANIRILSFKDER